MHWESTLRRLLLITQKSTHSSTTARSRGKDSAAQVEAIRHAQRVLAESGFYAGPHNGLPSATLTTSINEWQLAQGMPQTGKLDARTLAGLGIVGN